MLNKQEQMAAACKRLGKHVPAATDTRMKSVVCAGRAEELEGRKLGQPSQFSKGVCEDFSVEAKEFPLLEAVTREWLVKTQKAQKDLVCTVVICEV
jgi:hypothetical protein